ncbi:MAG: outer membrane beta-barrel protein [Candidatus Korobacteraceae bacterium]|jgi:hypothetical protein
MRNSRSLLLLACAFALLVSLFCVSAVAQIEIPQAQLTSSFSYLNSAKDSINQRGFEISSGYNWTRWLTLGGDFCHYAGAGNEFTQLPVVGNTDVPFNVNTYTVAVGTKFLLRKNKYVVPFVRPGLGLVHESLLTRQPAAIPFALIPVAGTSEAEYRMFYGVGGGLEIFHVVPHASIIVLSDYLHSRLFAETFNSYRISAGLSWHFGSKLVK